MERTLDVLALGEAMVEFNQRDARNFLCGFGGDTSNCTIAAARMGARAGYCTQVGDDVFGDQLIDLWQAEGVDIQGVRRVSGASTGIYFVTHGPQGHRFSYRRDGSAASRITPDGLPAGLIESSAWLHVSGISQAISNTACDTVFAALERARSAGTRVSYDLNYRPRLWSAPRARAMLLATLAYCELFLPSVDEIEALIGLSAPMDIIAWAHNHGAHRVALKLGAQGCLVSDGSDCVALPPCRVQALDATGAGDCFAGAMLARLSAGASLVEAARAANLAAARSTLGYGAVAPLPYWADVIRMMAAGDGPAAL
jgi:2-dehydro-3-deoxygluconokinase